MEVRHETMTQEIKRQPQRKEKNKGIMKEFIKQRVLEHQ